MDKLKPAKTEVIAEVICLTVTPQRQEWRSVKTGRRFDVLTNRGVTGAEPGDRAEVVLVEGSYLVRAKAVSPDDARPPG